MCKTEHVPLPAVNSKVGTSSFRTFDSDLLDIFLTKGYPAITQLMTRWKSANTMRLRSLLVFLDHARSRRTWIPHQILVPGTIGCAVLFMVLALLPLESRAGSQPPSLALRTAEYLSARPVSYLKPDQVISFESRQFFHSSSARSDTLRFWVFFADKGTEAGTLLQDAELKEVLLKHSLKRRAKVSKDYLLFADLPVLSAYVDAVVDAGAEHLSSTRWLNGAAFRLGPEDAGLLDEIAALPFVIEVRPCARGRRIPVDGARRDEIPVQRDRQPIPAVSADTIDYGFSLEQLEQIGSTIGHERGYTGEGVTLAMFDTGFRTSHQAFATAFAENRIRQWDFVNSDSNTANEAADPSNQWDHGTLTWSTAGAQWDTKVYGPAYGANFLLAKTEILGVENLQEEFYWIAALEWADSLGGDVVSSSLVFNGYPFSALDGATLPASIAAGTAADLGIIVCNGAGNSGPSPQSIVGPSDAFDILSVGAVDASSTIAGFSSHGPTADGRTVPSLCARGVFTYCAGANSDNWLQTASGTSLSTPLVAGVCAQLIQARPNFPPRLIMQALKETASRSQNVDNTYGHGVINLASALEWGVRMAINGVQQFPVVTELGVTTQFADSSDLLANAWDWTFGDGDSADDQNTSHLYSAPGLYDVSLTIQTFYGEISRSISSAIVVQADTITLHSDTAYAGHPVTLSVHLNNTLTLEDCRIPLDFSSAPITFDSVTGGQRITGTGSVTVTAFDSVAMTVSAKADFGSSPLTPGQGEIIKFYFTIDRETIGGTEGMVANSDTEKPILTSAGVQYSPHAEDVAVVARDVLRGDVNGNGDVTSADIIALVNWIFKGQNPPPTLQSGDANADLVLQSADIIYLVNYIFKSGPAPPSP